MKLHYTSGLRLVALLLQCPHWHRMSSASRVELSCCGAEKPADWHEIPWINMDFLNENSDVVMRLAGTDGKVLPPVSPYSCCTPTVLAACYHDPFQQVRHLDIDLIRLAGTDGKVLPPVSPYSCCTPTVLAACYHDPFQQVRHLDIDLIRLPGTDGKVLPPVSPYSCCTPTVLAACYHDPFQQVRHLDIDLIRLAGTDGKVLPPVSPYSCCTPTVLAACYYDPFQQVRHLDIDLIRLAGTDEKVLPLVSPYSCCTPTVLAACYHVPFQQSEYRDIWKEASPLPSASLHTQGCVEAVRAPLTSAILGLQIFNLLFIILELLRSSAMDAALSGACAGDGRGAVWGTLPRVEEPPANDFQRRGSVGVAQDGLEAQPGRAAVGVRVRREGRRAQQQQQQGLEGEGGARHA
ncbi:putative T14G10.6 [Operophtera brumata]|uniref:Putative T14G10.6 n=1 Tax=Operophtera brumata TaxID=104452 RepID=A0A0L7LLI9_OPEBR|nr:putative T14G10.6 [Operophtera brumata]